MVILILNLFIPMAMAPPQWWCAFCQEGTVNPLRHSFQMTLINSYEGAVLAFRS